MNAILIKWVCFGCLLGWTWSSCLSAEPPDRSLDDQLLQDLETELLDGLDGPGPARGSVGKAAGSDAPESIDRELLEQLGDGEDIELGGPQDPLTRIGRRMQLVRQRIAAEDTSESTQQLQQQIVRELEELLKQCRQCQKQPSSGAPSASPPRGSDQQQPAQSPDQRPSTKPARDSTTRIDQAEAARPTLEQRQEMIRRAWGHLPAKVREQMQNAGVEQFLPKYEELIEQYYKRLAEQPRSRL
jgi:hypothetical protein